MKQRHWRATTEPPTPETTPAFFLVCGRAFSLRWAWVPLSIVMRLHYHYRYVRPSRETILPEGAHA